MGIQPLLDVAGAPSTASSHSRRTLFTGSMVQQQGLPHTPPASTSGSPRIGFEVTDPNTHLPSLLCPDSPRETTQFSLPPLDEFDQGVEALARSNGQTNHWTPVSPLPSLTRDPAFLHNLTPRRPSWPRTFEDPAADFFSSRRGTVTSLSQYAIAADHRRSSLQGHSSPEAGYSYSFSSPSCRGQDCYPSPPPEGENRHINQKYTTEQGDFIIYAWHDKKMKWQRIKQEFARRFGKTPERTVQGLQAWYYRMNQRIPIWDEDGWLIFENEDNLEPKQISIKCRERDHQDKPNEPLGLAQRYPERAVNYDWVDPEIKLKARDWANKRASQYRERRERRRRKEHRRLKL
ncbi:hypothetical protein BGZ63DRAFT_112639 [Mariannaea sp. PMI_226]|nr:hypothetical protein BGZ63DRAFT_112639 [Mariannaea sp. PMI_226]